MPSKSKKQAKLMRAVAHGWKPSRIKGPTRAVAKEFVGADKRRDKVTGYQFGGGVPYRGVPPNRNPMSFPGQRPGGRGITPGGPGYTPGGPGTWAGRGGIPGGGMPGGAQGMAMPWQGPGPSPMSPMGQQTGALRQYMQRMQGGGGGPGGPGGPFANIGADYRRARGRQTYQDVVNRGGGGINPIMNEAGDRLTDLNRGPGGGQIGGSAPPPRGMVGRGYGGDPSAMAAKMRGMRGRAQPGGPRGPMGGALNQFRGAMSQLGGPGGGSFGKQPPGRRIAPPPGKYPGGGNPNIRGRNPMMRGAQRYGGRRGMMR